MIIYISLLNTITLYEKKKKTLLHRQSACDESTCVNNPIGAKWVIIH